MNDDRFLMDVTLKIEVMTTENSALSSQELIPY